MEVEDLTAVIGIKNTAYELGAVETTRHKDRLVIKWYAFQDDARVLKFLAFLMRHQIKFSVNPNEDMISCVVRVFL